MTSFFQDIRFGIRILLRSPGITAAVIFALALGIGVNSAMFSVVDALLLHPFPYRDPSTIVLLSDRDPKGDASRSSAGNYMEWRKAKTLSDTAAWISGSFVLTAQDQSTPITGGRVTANFFRTLGANPERGRTFFPGEDGLDGGQGGSRSVVISHQMWRDILGSDPNVLGRTITLSEAPYTVVGVMPPDFQFLVKRHQVWVLAPNLDPANRDYRYLTVVARRAASLDQVKAEMASISRALGEEFPKTNRGWTVQVDDLHEIVTRPVRTRLLLLFAAVGLVLLLACTNVASLLFARSAARNREIGVRVSLGASPGRIVRQLLTESIMLSLAGGALGLVLAILLINAAPTIVPPNAATTSAPIQLNMLVVLFTLGISVVTGVLFGLAPSVSLSRTDIRETLNESSRGSTGGRGSQLFRQVLVTIEVAVALVLLASAGLMTESLRRLSNMDLGFDSNHILTLRMLLPTARYDAARALQFHQMAMEAVKSLPGVERVAIGSNLPLTHPSREIPFSLAAADQQNPAERPNVSYITISPTYRTTLGIPLKLGRDFTELDNESSPQVVMINDAFATRYLPNQNPIGQRLLLDRPVLGKNGFADTLRVEIIGVLGTVKLADLDALPEPIVYAPIEQNVATTIHWLAVKTHGNPNGLAAAVRGKLADLDRSQPVDQIGSMEQTFNDQFVEPKFQSELMIAFAGLALVLAVIGIYGVNSYMVIQRRREIGVRVALGASPGDILRQIVGQGMRLTGVGIVLGLLAAFALNSVLRSILVDVNPTDPLVLAAVSLFLSAIAAIACYLPARRAMNINPTEALRRE